MSALFDSTPKGGKEKDPERASLLLEDFEEDIRDKVLMERATKIATSRRLAQAWIFALDINYGMYGTLSSYFLTEVIYGSDDDEKAVGLSTYYLIVWCSCNFLMAPIFGSVTDFVGRRPILLLGALTDTLVFPMMAALRTPTAVLLGAACVGRWTAPTTSASRSSSTRSSRRGRTPRARTGTATTSSSGATRTGGRRASCTRTPSRTL